MAVAARGRVRSGRRGRWFVSVGRTGLVGLVALVVVLSTAIASATPRVPHRPRSDAITSVSPATVALPPAIGTTHVLLIRVYWTKPDAFGAGAARKQLAEVHDWYDQSSYGQLDVVPTTVPTWLKIPGYTASGGDCWGSSGDTIDSQAEAAAAAVGYRPADYQHVIVYFPRDSCAADQPGAWGDQPGTRVWLDGYHDTPTIVHELGHNLGLSHSVRALCTDPISGQPVVLGAKSDCGDLPENWFDTMGTTGADFPWSFSAPVKDRLGWLGGRTARLTPGSTVTVAPLETSAKVDGAYLTTASGRQYWLEYRQQTGVDQTFLEPLTHGVLINMVDTSYYVSGGPILLDMHPQTADFIDAPLDAGQSWTSPEGYTFSVTAATAAGATVTVTAPLPTAPTQVAVTTDAKADTGTITWSPPTSDGGFAVTGYGVTRDGTDGTGDGPDTTVVPATARSQTFTDLAPGTTYTLSVQAITEAGTGPAATGRATIALAAPGRVRIGHATSGSRPDRVVSVTARWHEPRTGGRVGSYVVVATRTATGHRRTVHVGPGVRQVEITGLRRSAVYRVRVSAVNQTGSGRPSEKSNRVRAR